MSVAQTSSMYPCAPHSGLTVALLLSPSLYSPFPLLTVNVVPLLFAVSNNAFDSYISLILSAGLATIIARCQYISTWDNARLIKTSRTANETMTFPSKDVVQRTVRLWYSS